MNLIRFIIRNMKVRQITFRKLQIQARTWQKDDFESKYNQNSLSVRNDSPDIKGTKHQSWHFRYESDCESLATQNHTSYPWNLLLLFRGPAQAHVSHEDQLRLLREEPQWCWRLALKVSTGWVLPSTRTGGDTFPSDSPGSNHANHAPCRLLTSQRRQHISPPERDPATSSDADIQGLFAKRLNAALGPWAVHQMFTCTDRCLCWSSWFSSHYIIYQATDVITNAQTSWRRRLKYKFDFLVVWGHYSPDCTLLLN